MSHTFRDLLRKVGSGTHTGEDLTRAEAAAATRMILLQEATPAQIGAFLIAHRIKRPTGVELAGMLDAYDELGPHLTPLADARSVTVLGSPYDGRSRTLPISPMTALILATANCPVLMHGGRRMPTKEGEPLISFWQALGVDWTHLTLAHVQHLLEKTGLGFVYLPQHFPLAEAVVSYREQIGKRPPLATLELIWSPYPTPVHLVSGFVHPPTETLFRDALALRGTTCFTTVKGVEGSCDLPRERTAIIGICGSVSPPSVTSEAPSGFARLHLHSHDYGFEGKNVPLESVEQGVAAMRSVLEGKPTELMHSVLWNGGFYLWRCGAVADLNAGIKLAETLLTEGNVLHKLQDLQQAIATV